MTKEEMIERGITITRQFAKRQMTWMRSWPQLEALSRDSGIRLAEQIVVKSGLTR